jgi:hypothetical protein
MVTSEDLARVMALLEVEDEPLYVLRDHDPERGHAELFARVAAAATDGCRRAETAAGLSVDEAIDLHRDADQTVTADLVGLQRTRLAWAEHVLVRTRTLRPEPATAAVTTTLGALGLLLDESTGLTADPQLTDALQTLRDAADHLVAILRTMSVS